MKILYASCVSLIALSGTLGAQATSLNRFGDPAGIAADPTGLLQDPGIFPLYPRDLFPKRIAGAPVVAFVIDTTGHVEVATASFLNTSRPEFAKSVCDVLPRLRFQPFILIDHKSRVLLVEMFAFNTFAVRDTAGIRTASDLATRSQIDFATKPIAKVVEQLSSLPHCDSSGLP